MEYNLIINDKTVPVDLDIKEENRLVVSIEDKHFSVGYSRIGEHLLHLDVNGKKINTYIADTPDGREIFFNGKSYLVNDADALEQAGTKKSSGGQTADEITPPMPAVVVSVLVNEGDTIEKGQGVVVVSAMKMETTLFAPFAGNVTKVSVQSGDKVMPGEILVDIEKNEESTEPVNG
jgi:biotin carboxyl carrier protein